MKRVIDGRFLEGTIKIFQSLAFIGIFGGFLSMLVIMKMRGMDDFTGYEIYFDKIVLNLFNTVVMYSFVIFVVVSFLRNVLTEHSFVRYPYMSLNGILFIVIAGLSYLCIGIPGNNMASISDAGYQMLNMSEKYIYFSELLSQSLWIVLGLLVIVMILSCFKPFGKREQNTYKYRKIVLIITGICLIAGVFGFVSSEVRLRSMRNTEIADVDVSAVPDGEYTGTVAYGSTEVRVNVVVKNHQIVSIEDPLPSESAITLYARGVFDKIIEKQTPDVDAVTGATTTSKAYMKAVEEALKE